ncbi:hypothetical protein EDF57_10665 [Novosphingobium sp. PhB55]|uniref:hypothetical protein n=1 Tax=Novosphingobium sp. PhB55 TaxID=2485106 RepID=UPI001066D307|nr:hypothetical protein [Novosphingobium sp. PhB55]TDW63110.1 hypothetical protein EDF57_10665 [Novosphingobium sp. PhB55]
MASRQFALDLTRYHSRQRHGDLDVFMTWFGDRLDPVLVLVPAFIEGHENVTPCVVPQSTAWMWSEAIGDGAHCARTSHIFCKHLRLEPDPMTCIRITSIIRDHIGDLLSIPPAPFEREVVADAIRIDSNGKEHHTEVTDRV